MKTFRTIIPTISYPFEIDYKDQITCLGSCFTENIGLKLLQHKFKVLTNPFGILYNIYSIQNCLRRITGKKKISEKELIYRDGLYHHWDLHGSLSSISANQLLENVNQTIAETYDHLIHSSVVFISLGSAYTYVLKKDKKLVANCHKFPSSYFTRQLSSIQSTEDCLQEICESLKEVAPHLKLIFTISPVRHLKDGMIENNRSKAILISSVQNVVKANSNAFYFPSFEILMDDLRDYRFYDKDLLHPNELAIDYIWDYFKTALLSEDTKKLLLRIYSISKEIQHKALHPQRKEHLNFLKSLRERMKTLEAEYTFLNYENEVEKIEVELKKFSDFS